MKPEEGNTGVEKERELIANILKENITFSGQLNGYVIHGAIDKILEAHEIEIQKLQGLIVDFLKLTKHLEEDRHIEFGDYGKSIIKRAKDITLKNL